MIVPSYLQIEDWARNNGVKFESHEDLCANPKVRAMMKERIDTLQQTLSHYEQIKRFTLLPKPFTMENGELTNTLKLRRPQVSKNYKELIDKMYEE